MASDVEIGRALDAVAATLNHQHLDVFDTGRVQEIVTAALGGEQSLSVDDGGGLHDDSGRRVGAIRRTPSGEWITERQNELAEGSGTPVPVKPQEYGLKGRLSRLKKRF
jgi:hypothetical protein